MLLLLLVTFQKLEQTHQSWFISRCGFVSQIKHSILSCQGKLTSVFVRKQYFSCFRMPKPLYISCFQCQPSLCVRQRWPNSRKQYFFYLLSQLYSHFCRRWLLILTILFAKFIFVSCMYRYEQTLKDVIIFFL